MRVGFEKKADFLLSPPELRGVRVPIRREHDVFSMPREMRQHLEPLERGTRDGALEHGKRKGTF